MQEKETEVIEQHIGEESGVIKKPFLERRTRVTSTVPKLKLYVMWSW